MTKKEERGWFIPDAQWMLIQMDLNIDSGAANSNSNNNTNLTEEKPLDEYLYPADETRSKCRICGVNFDMIFHNQHGDFMYKNCIEMDVLELESDEGKVLVHE